MPSTLFITVGGSPQPIITCVEALQPDRVVFVCSGGKKGSCLQVTQKGKPCKIYRGGEVVEEFPNLPTYLGLVNFVASNDLILLENLDDLGHCYAQITESIEAALQAGEEPVVEYSGGTKSMAAALALVAVDQDLDIYLTTGPRDNTRKIEFGEFTERVSTARVFLRRLFDKEFPELFQRGDYPAAIALLQSALKRSGINAGDKQEIRSRLDLCSALDAWDRFDHQTGLQFLQPHFRDYSELGQYLKRVIQSHQALTADLPLVPDKKCHGYEIVEDLLLNAERRASQIRFDDAVGRLYRAVELLCQIWLRRKYGFDTGQADWSRIPEQALLTLRSALEAKTELPNEISLRQSYNVVAAIPDDPLGCLFRDHENQIIDTLKIRNGSLFAHGFTPVDKDGDQRAHQVWASFVEEGIKLCAGERHKSSIPFPVSFG